uniref:Gypsy retrotransposon integrase-like protein 1 n=1 Tax=Sander lucioperca TaxID=283035 RepID=A0A8C9ZTG8_SANLU
MDSAGSDKVQNALRAQGQRLHQFEEVLSAIQQELSGMAERQQGFQQAVCDQVSRLTTQFQAIQSVSTPPASQDSLGPASTSEPSGGVDSAAPPVPSSASFSAMPHLSRPERFSGESGDCRAFLTQCGLHFELQSVHYPTDRTKIAYLISHLSGRAEAWATAEWIFQHVTPGREAARMLVNLRQGRRRVADYAIEFRTVAAESGWNQTALMDAFLCGLSSALKDHLAALDLPEDLDTLIALAIKIDKRLFERERERGDVKSSSRDYYRRSFPSSGGVSSPPPQPVDSPSILVSHTSVTNCSSRPLFSVTVASKGISRPLEVMVDSGADVSLMDISLARELGLCSIPLPVPLRATALDGRFLWQVTHQTSPVILSFPDHHSETLSFLLVNSSLPPVILGFPWLSEHNPHIDWTLGVGVILEPALGRNLPDLSSVPSCYKNLGEVFNKSRATALPPHRTYDCPIDLLPGSAPPKGLLYSLSSPETVAMKDYIDSALEAGIIRPSSSPAGAGFFFVGKKDWSLRPCIDYRGLNDITVKNRYPLPLLSSAFELLQGATVFSKLDLRNAYHLVRIREGDEWKTAFNTPSGHYEYLVMPFGLTNAPAVFQALVNDVLRDMLNVFVFVYLDDILIFSRNLDEHINHVRAVLQRLLNNDLFVKAEKCEFHVPKVSFLGYVVAEGEMSMDPEKVKAVKEWPTPTNRKEVQRFLGFANFYRKFIRNFSSVAAPLHKLTSSKSRFVWSPQTDSAFQVLKERFVTAPVLTMSDPCRQFVVEVDASNVGLGAILSQRLSTDGKLHPCAFLSRKLSPAERNYDVGNRELLAVKVALEEWRHWLEGAEHPFLVWTDHKNLEYLRSAKRLNSRQARWALFFNHFNFSLSYRPGSKNTKPDALSRLFDTDSLPKSDETILPGSCVVGAVSWEVEERVKRATIDLPVPVGCPLNRLFVPSELRSQVVHWAHSSMLSCHPGVKRTVFVVRQRFWWPRIVDSVKEYVAACPVCAQHKSLHQPPAGLLHPLPVPSRPWSDISLDFVTGLPLSEGNTTILTIVDRFSKMVHFVPLPKLPSAKELAEVMLSNVFKLHGLPRDVVSDRGPQFISRFWRAFCNLLGATVSLSSGYHPQSNGQSERLNQELEVGLRCLSSRNPASWSKQLIWVEYSHNTLPCSSTGLSPFQFVHLWVHTSVSLIISGFRGAPISHGVLGRLHPNTHAISAINVVMLF